MKRKILTILACFMLCLCVLTGCGGEKGLSGGPKPTDTVYGNGGYAVRKGEYVYFTNAIFEGNLTYKRNNYGKEKLSAIYRAKLNAQGVIDTNEDGIPTGSQIVAKQIAGFSNSGIYIFGNYIYYATPRITKDSDGDVVNDLISFKRIKLDGTDHKTIYNLEKRGEDFKFEMYQANGRVYVLVLNDSKLISASIKLNSDKVTTETLAKKVTSAVFPKTSTITSDYKASSFNNYVYYTRSTTLKTDGIAEHTYIGKVNINGKSDPQEIKITDKTYTLVEVNNNRLYYTLDDILYSTDLAQNDIDNATQYSYNKLTSYKIVSDQVIGSSATDLGIVAVLSNSLVYYNALNDYITLVDGSTKAVTLQYVSGNYAYYTVADDTALYRKVIYRTRTEQEKLAEKTLAGEKVIDSVSFVVGEEKDEEGNVTSEGTKMFDFDDNYIFYFSEVENSNKKYNYLHMIKIGAKNEESKSYSQFMGKLDKKDILEDKD